MKNKEVTEANSKPNIDSEEQVIAALKRIRKDWASNKHHKDSKEQGGNGSKQQTKKWQWRASDSCPQKDSQWLSK